MSDSVVSLFSGAGGLSYGFTRAGLRPSFAADLEQSACDTYSANLGITSHNLDLGVAQQETIERLIAPFANSLAVIGGPPCQGFSTAGSRRGGDPRNKLVFRYLEIVDRLSPRWFLFENVEGILTSNGGESIRDLLGCFISRGYVVRIEKLNFAAFGLPQSRKRVLIVGNKIGQPFRFPAETHSYRAGKHKGVSLLPFSPTFSDAVGDLPNATVQPQLQRYDRTASNDYAKRLREGNTSELVRLHHANPNAQEIEKYRMLGPGKTMKDLPESYWHKSYKARAFRRVADGMPTEKRGGAPAGIRRLLAFDGSPTITSAATREFIHPTEDRPLTLREAARLQSFPDSFEFCGRQAAIATQIGNAVPPLAAEFLARHLMELDGKSGGWKKTAQVAPGLLGFRLTDASGKSPALQRTEDLLLKLSNAGQWREQAYAS